MLDVFMAKALALLEGLKLVAKQYWSAVEIEIDPAALGGMY